MIELRDTVEVDVSPDKVWDWLQDLPEHYLAWHPDHLGARWVGGCTMVPGALLEVREVLHGKPHRLRLHLTEVERGRSLRYSAFPGLGGTFRVSPSEHGSEFTATITFGTRARVVGPALDLLLRLLLGRRIAAIRRHQAEEGANLKALLEHG